MELSRDEFMAGDGIIYRVVPCRRCKGTGMTAYLADAGICFRCEGMKVDPQPRRVEPAERRRQREQEQQARRRRVEKARRRREREQRRAERTAYAVCHFPETLEALLAYDGGDSFLRGMAKKAWINKGLTGGQLQAVDRSLRAEARAQRAAHAVLAYEATLEGLLAYDGADPFLGKLARKAINGGDLTDRQLKAASCALREEERAQRAAYAAYHYTWALEALIGYDGADAFLQAMAEKAGKGGDLSARQIAAADKALREERRAERAAYGVLHYPETLTRLLAYEGDSAFLAKLRERARAGGDLTERQLAKAAEAL